MREQINKFGFSLLKPLAGFMLSGSTRVRALIIAQDEVLLARSWVGSQRWSMPGGGIRKGEKPKNGLKRELHEELDLNIQTEHYRQIMKIKQNEHGAEFAVIIFQMNVEEKRSFKIRKSEIIEAAWHKIDALPDNLHPLVNEALRARKK